MVLASPAGLFALSPQESVCQSGHGKLWPEPLAYLESQTSFCEVSPNMGSNTGSSVLGLPARKSNSGWERLSDSFRTEENRLVIGVHSEQFSKIFLATAHPSFGSLHLQAAHAVGERGNIKKRGQEEVGIGVISSLQTLLPLCWCV